MLTGARAFWLLLLTVAIPLGCATDSATSFQAGVIAQTPAGASAGASDYIHFGEFGLCKRAGNGDAVRPGQISLQRQDRLVVIRGGSIDANSAPIDIPTLVRITPLSNGNDNHFDDLLEISVTVFVAGVDQTNTETLPLFDIGVGEISGFTTSNTPRRLFVQKIEYLGGDYPTAVINDSRVPMYATGHFNDPGTGDEGFLGGDGPECIRGSGLADIINTRGGDDYVAGAAGNDTIIGGAGDDTLEGGLDDDRLFGQRGLDRLRGEGGRDCHHGGRDGLRDVLDDGNMFDTYVREEGILNGVEVSTIEIITAGDDLSTSVSDCN